jgi:ATP-dependent RNA helicase RhlB
MDQEASNRMNDTTLTDTRFDSLNLDPRLLNALGKMGFELCTPIQAESLPLLLQGKDVAGQGQTGTGKTAAFLLGTLQYLLNRPAEDNREHHPRALILAPTRELAIQIHKDAVGLVGETGLKLGLAYGGVDYDKQRKELADGVDILIGTPGRIIDYFKQKVFSLKHIQVVVLDEADRMFDLGFIDDIRYVLRRMPDPTERLNLLFSATLSHRVMELAYEHMNDPNRVTIESDSVTADQVTQHVFYPANNDKIPLLVGLLQKHKPFRCIVFANTKRNVERIYDTLVNAGYKAGMLSGDVAQPKREKLVKRFGNGELDVLIATDVAARGLHVPEVSHVFNFDLPQDAEDYVHRIGRTARIGAEGDAISFACEDSAIYLPEIEAYIGFKIDSMPVSGDLLAEVEIAPRRRRPPRSGKPGGRPGGGRSSGGRTSGGRSASGKPQQGNNEQPKVSSEQKNDAESQEKTRRRRRRRSSGQSNTGSAEGSSE